jgi:rhomboid protease GluP
LRPDTEALLRWGANFAPLTVHGEWWRLMTSMFLHGGLLHLAFNMWALHDNGKLVERVFGNVHFLVIYFGSGLAGSLASLAWRQDAVSVGASGAIFGVFGALLAFALRQRTRLTHFFRRLKANVLLFIGISLGLGFMVPGIDNGAHLGGLLAGFAAGWLMVRSLDRAQRRRMAPATLFLGALFLSLAAAGLLQAIPKDVHRHHRDQAALEALRWFVEEEKTVQSETRLLVDQVRTGSLGEQDLGWRLQTQVVPRWATAVARLQASLPDTGSPLRRRYEMLLRYAMLRHDAMAAFAVALRTGDRALLDDFERLREEGDRLLKELEQQERHK